MNFGRKLGWILIVVGTITLISPFIHGSTGYFAASYTSYLPAPENFLQLPVIAAGFALAIIGYLLAKPKQQSPVTV